MQQDSTILERSAVDRIIQAALDEDIGTGDITTELLIPEDQHVQVHFTCREPMVVCGLAVVERTFRLIDHEIEWHTPRRDGEYVAAHTHLITLDGPAHSLLTAERTALNLMQRMSGVATLTRDYVEAIKGTKATVLDTRKTMPGLRILDKYATHTGGAQNHRMGLYDRILIKDNHIAVVGSIAEAVARAKDKRPKGVHIQVECDTEAQVAEALDAKPDSLLLDNMSPDRLRTMVKLVDGVLPLEASGGVNLETIRSIAETGVDFISVGGLTHSAPAVDIGLDIHFV